MGFMGIGDSDSGSGGYLNQAAQAIGAVQLPNIEAMKVKLQQLVSAGVLTPEDARTYLQEASEYGNIQLDPTARNAQMQALQGLQNEVTSGGNSAIDRAALLNANDAVNQNLQGQRGAIMQNAAERGISGSGIELTNQLMAQQSASQNAAHQATDVAGQAAQRALQSMMASGQLGGQIESQDYAQASNKAAAQDAINRFNTQNQQNVNLQNVAARNQAQQFNLQNQQNLSNQNTQNANQNAYYDAGLQQQSFQNQMNKASALGSVYSAKAAAANAQAQRNAGFMGNILGTAGTVVGAIYGGPAGAAAGGALGKTAGDSLGGKKGAGGDEMYAAFGGKVPGRATVKGDSYANDQVPAVLSPGEVVVPRSVAQHPSQVKSFVQHAPKPAMPRAPTMPGMPAMPASPPSAPHPHDLEAILSALAHIRAKGGR
jgi:hypothetical protein